jgi:hypothetical protein
MSDLTKSSDAHLSDGMNQRPQSRQAGVELAAGDAVYIDSNGLLQKAGVAAVYTGATGTVAFAGLTARAIPSGTVGEVYGQGAEFFYADSALTINSYLWGSATAGKIGDAKVGSAADLPVAQVVSATNIILLRGV